MRAHCRRRASNAGRLTEGGGMAARARGARAVMAHLGGHAGGEGGAFHRLDQEP
jgi:hypothetical protein